MKYVMILIACAMLVGCSGNPVPETSVNTCIEKGKYPWYWSNGFITRFECLDRPRSNKR